MTPPAFDRDAWEQRWQQVLAAHPEMVRSRPPNAQVVAELGDLAPGLALDAGCGHGAESMWMASAGWQVDAVDFSAAALAHAAESATGLGDESARIDWIEGDLSFWTPEPGRYDLVSCVYVHLETPISGLIERLAGGVAPGGTLFLLGHLPTDPATGGPSLAADQRQVTVVDARRTLDPEEWDLQVTEERPHQPEGTGMDAVIRAVRR